MHTRLQHRGCHRQERGHSWGYTLGAPLWMLGVLPPKLGCT